MGKCANKYFFNKTTGWYGGFANNFNVYAIKITNHGVISQYQ